MVPCWATACPSCRRIAACARRGILARRTPADIKRVGPASLDLCKVADGTYDAYFEPMLHVWDIPAIAAGTVVVWEAQGTLSRWDGERIHWRHDNDVVASNGLIIPRTTALPAPVSVARLHQPAIIF